jgi:hypothetical protein
MKARTREKEGGSPGHLWKLLALLVPTTLALALSAWGQTPGQETPPQLPVSLMSAKAQVLLNQEWSDSSFDDGLSVIADRKETKESRALAIEILHANRRKLSATDMRRFLDEVTIIAKDAGANEEFSALGVRTMGNLALTMGELGQISAGERIREAAFLIEAATNGQRGVGFRASAISTLGILRVAAASPALRRLLDESGSINLPDIARPACMALVRIDGEGAMPVLAAVVRKTTDARVFGTAAFALGQIKKPESVGVLVESLERFPDSAACDAALVSMEEVVTNILNNWEDENLIPAIRATRHLWREGQRERYVPLLRGLLTRSELGVRKAALDRLLEVASTLDFEKEKEELASILRAIRDSPEFTDYQQRIQARLAATLLAPVAGHAAPTPNAQRGGR